MGRHVYGRVLALAGRVASRRRLPDQGPLASGSTRRIAALIDDYLERHEDLPGKLSTELLEHEGLLRGLSLADAHDAGNAGIAWARSVIMRVSLEHGLAREPVSGDNKLAQLHELLGRQYVQFGDWSTASECFTGAALRWTRRTHKRKALSQVIVCCLRGGDTASASALLNMVEGLVSHRPSQHFLRITGKLLSAEAEIDARDEEQVHEVRRLGVINYGYLASCLVRRLAAEGHFHRALRVTTRTLDRLRQDQADTWVIGDLEQQAASIHNALGEHEQALRLAVAAWAKLDAPRYQACSRAQRQSTWGNFAPSRYAALRAAVELGDGRALAELIESCRLQSLVATELEIDHREEQEKVTATGVRLSNKGEPRLTDGGMSLSTAVFAAVNDAFTSTRLNRPAPVAYQGTSLLAPHYSEQPGAGPAPDPCALDDALPQGVFWSSHVENGVMFWFLAEDGKPVAHGMTDLREDEHLQPVLRSLAGCSESAEPETWNLPPHRAESGEHYEPLLHLAQWRSPEEQIMSSTVGGLLPPPLVDLLSEAAKRKEPLRLTLAPAREFGCVPWPIAVVPGSSDRLVERATLRTWTSAPTQLARKARAPHPPSSPVPFLIACDNPDGTLRERTTGSAVSLAWEVLGGPTSASPATRQALLSALHRIDPKAHGLFFYRGHARPDLAWSGLPLAGGDPLRAGELLGSVQDGTPLLPMPARVIVSYCSGSGGSLTGGEGVGLAAGLVQSGAEQVVATSVDVLDAPFTEAFEDMLIKGMLVPDLDHAEVLRAVQLRMLREWKVFSLRGRPARRADIREPHPIIWTAYQAY
ncbi:CHAT domain-containing protein [Kutzneria albida]|uniref:CHAT domain-containing protein n=1 Tax=Kutzneria albida DSM 43870 TaxID=1449976 RepID=W5WNZ9_9PSEU|nr:CHAT domain-containing protein [Kutzneria albida]AHH99899.1 hypothetical protein KALB_6540 [Kutzneria albida DSM 43870]